MMHCNRFVAAATGRGWRRRWVGPDLTAVVARHVRWVVPTSPAINVEESGLTLGTSPPTDQSMFAASGTCRGGDGACHQGAWRTGFSTRGRCSDWCVTQTARSSLLTDRWRHWPTQRPTAATTSLRHCNLQSFVSVTSLVLLFSLWPCVMSLKVLCICKFSCVLKHVCVFVNGRFYDNKPLVFLY